MICLYRFFLQNLLPNRFKPTIESFVALFAIALFSMIISACSSNPPKGELPLTFTQWELDSIGLNTVPYKYISYISISTDRKSIKGFAGCSLISGDIEINKEKSSIKVKRINSSNSKCRAIEQEKDFINALYEASSYKKSSDELVIFDNNGNEVIKLNGVIESF